MPSVDAMAGNSSTLSDGSTDSNIPAHHLLSNVATSSTSRTLERVEVTYNELPDLRDALLLREASYSHQYANLYFIRYTQLAPIVLDVARRKWDSIDDGIQSVEHGSRYVNKILNVKPGILCFIIGTLYIEMQLKPNILDEVTKEHWTDIPTPREKFYSEKDEYMLEDKFGRIKLTGDKLKKEILVTGIIMAVLGNENTAGEFEVVDICYAGLPSQKHSDEMETEREESDAKYVALVSGLNIGNDYSKSTQLDLFMDYMTGDLGSSQDQKMSSKIARLVIAGNSLTEARFIEDENKLKKYGYDVCNYDEEPTSEFDTFLEAVVPTINVDLMPGPQDPSNATLPQQPINSNFLPKASRYSSFHAVTNPYWCEIDDVIFLGTSGQTIDDIFKYVESNNRLEFAEKTLLWRHIAPTSPDTLWCYPFSDEDPFILSQTPHVYFIGNQKEFATTVIEGADGQYTRIILLPSFAETGLIVLARPTREVITNWRYKTARNMPPKAQTALTDGSKLPPAKRHRLDTPKPDSGSLTKQEEEEMSNAYIAKLLAEDEYLEEHPYYSEYNSGTYETYYESDDTGRDDDYNPHSKNRHGKPKKQANTRGKKRKLQNESSPTADEGLAETFKNNHKPPKFSGAVKIFDEFPKNSDEEFPGVIDETIKNDNFDGFFEPRVHNTVVDGVLQFESKQYFEPPSEIKPSVVQPLPGSEPSLSNEISVKTDFSSAIKSTMKSDLISTFGPQPGSDQVAFKKRKERISRPKTPGTNSGTYTEQEEYLFIEALELWGRDWQKLAEHIGTRDPNSIRSHAQKHFIKLYRDGLPLPVKVQESGCGYTLSGKDLDPDSAAAKPYLSKLKSRNDFPVQTGSPPSGTTTPKSWGDPRSDSYVPISTSASTTPDGRISSRLYKIPKIKEERDKKIPRVYKRKEQKVTKESPPDLNVENSYGADGRTEYAKSRLRSVRERPSINFVQIDGEDTDPFAMVKCEPFYGIPNSNTYGCQPFSINVESNVLLAMDFHAHLMQTEIIGFLAGHWNAEEKKLIIKATFPCRSLETGQDHTNVEMDPTSEWEVRQAIHDRDMRVVGWYHSHPTFAPDPSIIDLQNQKNYQQLFRDDTKNEEPFVGAIIGPYDRQLPGSLSVINWYYVNTSFEERGQPKQLTYDLINNDEFSKEEADELLKLVEEYRTSEQRVNFQEYWRQDCEETKLDKLIKSLGKRMPWLYMGRAQQQNINSPIMEKSVNMANPRLDQNDQTPTDCGYNQIVDEIDFDAMELGSFTSTDTDPWREPPGVSGMLRDQFLQRVEHLLKDW
ncbi:hypothetical protein G9A89_016326 [Geosiphon pyriformis]|nr:hypothetical protein G9A89_016326 [Geosiphon pyriformis]